MYHLLPNDNSVYFDVDDTLVMYDWPADKTDELVFIQVPGIDAPPIALWPHRQHIERLKQFRSRKQGVVVWSQGGYEWAKAVVDALQLGEYVDLVTSKPKWIFDDLSPAYWLKDRSYVDPVTGKSNRNSSCLDDKSTCY